MEFALKIIIWSILTGILTALIIVLFLTRKSELEKSVNKRKYLFKLIFNVLLFTGAAGGGYLYLWTRLFRQDIRGVKFPSTGPDPDPQFFFQLVKDLYSTPIDGIITLFLFILIAFLARAVFQNISDKKKIERELEKAKIAERNVLEDLRSEKEIIKRSEEKYHKLVDVMEEGLGVLNKNGIITFMNRRGCGMLGYTQEELFGKPAEFVFDEENIKILREQMIKIKGGEHKSYEIAWLRKDGSKIDTITSPSPSFNDNGDLVESVAVFTDITREKEIDRAKSEFVSLASHQLRTPLTGIEWTIELFLKKEKLTEDGNKYLNDIRFSAARLSKLIKLLLDVSRIESGRIGIFPESLELVEFIDGCVSEFKVSCEEKKLTLTFVLHPEKLAIVTDRNMLGYIIHNLISNAMNYTMPWGKVEISAEEKDGVVLILVRDTGIGIPKKEGERIFQKFVRASNAVAAKPDGTGLGLYIASEAVKLLGGRIWFESEEGKGSVFFIELPLVSRAREGEKRMVLESKFISDNV